MKIRCVWERFYIKQFQSPRHNAAQLSLLGS
nr:MAG TPA: hypothetical protein [Caudoviricetes sp.]